MSKYKVNYKAQDALNIDLESFTALILREPGVASVTTEKVYGHGHTYAITITMRPEYTPTTYPVTEAILYIFLEIETREASKSMAHSGKNFVPFTIVELEFLDRADYELLKSHTRGTGQYVTDWFGA